MMKVRARNMVANALKSRKLVRPQFCDECHQPGPTASDGRATIHAHHHKGYEFPLDVIWLCPSCHFQIDRRVSKEAHGNAKLNSKITSIIRRRYEASGGGRNCPPNSNSAKSLAKEFGVSRSTILRVVNNQNWIN